MQRKHSWRCSRPAPSPSGPAPAPLRPAGEQLRELKLSGSLMCRHRIVSAELLLHVWSKQLLLASARLKIHSTSLRNRQAEIWQIPAHEYVKNTTSECHPWVPNTKIYKNYANKPKMELELISWRSMSEYLIFIYELQPPECYLSPPGTQAHRWLLTKSDAVSITWICASEYWMRTRRLAAPAQSPGRCSLEGELWPSAATP